MKQFYTFINGTACYLADIPVLSRSELGDALQAELESGARVCAMFAAPANSGDSALRLYLVLAKDAASLLAVAAFDVADGHYPALTPKFPALHLFEREIYEQFQVTPQGHPWLKPLRFTGETPVGLNEFFKVSGTDVHEVAVGPIHAGIIESGHFRFQCLGENVMHLEISLGYQHRGVEAALNSGSFPQNLPQMLALTETLAGDSSIAHTWACCAVLEGLAGLTPSPRGQTLREVALELERLANHTGDLGALAGDVGYLPTSSFCGRLRGDFLNMTALICGNRFGRGLVRPGGVARDLDDKQGRELLQRLEATWRDTNGAVELLWESPSVTARMMGIGQVSEQDARNLGLVGPVARASGLSLDARYYHSLPGLKDLRTEPPVFDSGDVYARAQVRQREIGVSASLVSGLLRTLPAGKACRKPASGELKLAADCLCVALVEGWRGEVLHAALTGPQGNLTRYKLVDPSFHNWMGLALALRGGQISDFPLCNKSFNLSYCGVDL